MTDNNEDEKSDDPAPSISSQNDIIPNDVKTNDVKDCRNEGVDVCENEENEEDDDEDECEDKDVSLVWDDASENLDDMINEFGDCYSKRWDSGILPILQLDKNDDRVIFKVLLDSPYELMGHCLIELDGFTNAISMNVKWKTEFLIQTWDNVSDFVNDDEQREKFFSILRSMSKHTKSITIKDILETHEP